MAAVAENLLALLELLELQFKIWLPYISALQITWFVKSIQGAAAHFSQL